MGQAHTLLTKPWMDDLKTRPDLITFISEKDFGEELYLCIVDSHLLPPGNNGSQVTVKLSDNPIQIKFIRDVDT